MYRLHYECVNDRSMRIHMRVRNVHEEKLVNICSLKSEKIFLFMLLSTNDTHRFTCSTQRCKHVIDSTREQRWKKVYQKYSKILGDFMTGREHAWKSDCIFPEWSGSDRVGVKRGREAGDAAWPAEHVFDICYPRAFGPQRTDMHEWPCYDRVPRNASRWFSTRHWWVL